MNAKPQSKRRRAKPRQVRVLSHYGAGLVYYSTFYRDVKSALETRRSTDALKQINTLLEKILLLYNASLSSVSTTSEKVKEIEGFYKSLSLLNDDMMNLTEYLSDI